jgi:NAD(P)H-hydrate epimerase
LRDSPTWLYGAADSRAIDARAINELGIPGFELMQRAARFAFDCLLAHWAGLRSVTVICGKGNNAGDAYLVAKLAHEIGLSVQLIAVTPPAQLQGDAALAFRDASDAGLVADETMPEISGEVIVDGLLGTGVRGEVQGPLRKGIDAVNSSGRPVLSIDVPSGIHSDTGATAGVAVRADVTCMFITRKIGLYTGPGVGHAGVKEYDDLGVPPEFLKTAHALPLRQFDRLALPDLDINTYKHRQGHVLIVGGDRGMPGAVAMAAHAALRVGAGMVTVVTRAAHSAPIIARTPEVMVADADGDDVDALVERVDLLVVGPGMGRNEWGQALFGRVVDLAERSEKPMVVDADGLYWLAETRAPRTTMFITPHIAEAGRLLGVTAGDVQADRLGAAAALRDKFGTSGVIKGAGSVVFALDSVAICGHGNPGMATAGMGDVLSGLVGGMVVQDQDRADELFLSAVLLHSAAADVAATRFGARSLVATDVIAEVPGLLSGVGA